MIIPAYPVLLLKIYTNSIFITLTNKRENYRGENITQLLVCLLLSPFIIAVSVLVDLLSLPNILLRESIYFEHKYQLSQDRLNDVQIPVVMATLVKILYTNWEEFKGTHMSLMQLMEMHRGIFKIINNLHDLVCNGTKDYKEAVSNVQDYNMTKILTRMCSIPDINGIYKQAKVELNCLWCVQMDIERYNYVDCVLRRLRMGILREEQKDKVKSSQ